VSKRAERRRREREGQTSSGGGGSSPLFMKILIGVGVLAAGLVVWNMVFSAGSQGAREPVELVYDSADELVAMAQGVSRGDPDAPLTLMDFSDYQCPSCAAFTFQAKPLLEMQYIEEGLLRFVYYDFPLVGGHRNAFLAARAARCAGDQDRYWDYHDVLFREQPNWATQSDPFSSFVGYAADVGLDRGEFRSCLGSDRHAEVVTANMQLGRQLGVSGTPTLFLDSGEGRGERVEGWDPERLGGAIEGALERLGYGDQLEDDPEDGDE
jgi:protein-disulfide isomerase